MYWQWVPDGCAGFYSFRMFYQVLCCLRLFERREWSGHVNCWMRTFVGVRGNWRGWVFGFCCGVFFSSNITTTRENHKDTRSSSCVNPHYQGFTPFVSSITVSERVSKRVFPCNEFPFFRRSIILSTLTQFLIDKIHPISLGHRAIVSESGKVLTAINLCACHNKRVRVSRFFGVFRATGTVPCCIRSNTASGHIEL